MNQILKTERTRARRLHERASYDRETIHAILDAGLICHVGYVVDGLPYVTPTIYWREGERVYWHGSSASRMLRNSAGAEVCLTVSHLDGLVLARSGFHHSANYRAVMLFGKAERVTDPAAILRHMETFIDGLYPGRWDQLRPVNEQELKATALLSLRIEEASAKLRLGPPKDDEDDYALAVWAGVLPLTLATGVPIPDPRNKPGLTPPAGLADFKLG